MAQPLELSYTWRTPVVVSSVAVAVCIGVVARSRVLGWWSAALILFALWLFFVALVYVRTRAYLMVDGSTLTVRRFRAFHRIEGAQVIAIKEFLTPNGPSYKLTVAGEDGRTGRRVVPTALLRTGHSTLFGWILAWSPQAELDKGARRTLERLRIRGLLE